MPTQINIADLVRSTSAKGKVLAALADGKKHSLSTIRKMVIKHGSSGSGIGAVYGLGRILVAAKAPKRIVLSREDDTVQLVSAAPKKSAKKSSKPAAKKAAPVTTAA